MAASLFGVEVGAAKSVGTARVGSQGARDPAAAISTALSAVSSQQSMNLQPDPTLGAPFASFPSNRLTVAQMGPGEPAENFPLGAEPRQWKYRVGWNFPTTPDTDRGINGELLRYLADSSWLLRRCIEVRKSEICSLEWEIVGRGRTVAQKKDSARRNEALIAHLTEWLRYPEAYYALDLGSKGMPSGVWQEGPARWKRRGLVEWTDWLSACMEDVLVGDWLSLWPQRTIGGEMLGLRRVDGEHIKALLDLDGRTPPPPMPAWQQYLYGVPRASWAADEFYYLPRTLRNMTPYGYSSVQQSLVMINEALRFDMWNTAAYTESRIPMGLLESAPGQSTEQIKDVADFLNGAFVTLASRQMVYPVPSGTKWQPIKPFVFDEKFAMYVIEGVCACLGVQPQDLGYAPARSGLGGSGFAVAQEGVRNRNSLVPTARWVEAWLTRIINEQWRDEGGGELAFRFQDLVQKDVEAVYKARAAAVMSGQTTLDEIAVETGQEAVHVGRIIETKSGTVFLDKGIVLTPTGIIPFRAPEAGEQLLPGAHTAGPEASGIQAPPAAKAAKADDAAGLQRRHEEEFFAAWLLWWRTKADAAEEAARGASGLTRPERARDLLALSHDDETALSEILERTLRGPLYAATMDRLRAEAQLPIQTSTEPSRSDVLRRQTVSQAHIVEVAATYRNQLDTEFQRLLAETEDDPDEGRRARVILAGLIAWLLPHVLWKGRQIAATEAARAISDAKTDFNTQNPRVFRMYRWRAVMDERTCAECASLDGQVIDPVQGPRPPAHPSCRCDLVPVAAEPVRASADNQPVLVGAGREGWH